MFKLRYLCAYLELDNVLGLQDYVLLEISSFLGFIKSRNDFLLPNSIYKNRDWIFLVPKLNFHYFCHVILRFPCIKQGKMQLSPVLYRQKTTTMVTLITGYVGNVYLIYFTLKYGFFGKHLRGFLQVGPPLFHTGKIIIYLLQTLPNTPQASGNVPYDQEMTFANLPMHRLPAQLQIFAEIEQF